MKVQCKWCDLEYDHEEVTVAWFTAHQQGHLIDVLQKLTDKVQILTEKKEEYLQIEGALIMRISQRTVLLDDLRRMDEYIAELEKKKANLETRQGE